MKGQDTKVQNLRFHVSVPRPDKDSLCCFGKITFWLHASIPHIKWRQRHFITSSQSHKDKLKTVKCPHAMGLKVIQNRFIGKSKKHFNIKLFYYPCRWSTPAALVTKWAPTRLPRKNCVSLFTLWTRVQWQHWHSHTKKKRNVICIVLYTECPTGVGSCYSTVPQRLSVYYKITKLVHSG